MCDTSAIPRSSASPMNDAIASSISARGAIDSRWSTSAPASAVDSVRRSSNNLPRTSVSASTVQVMRIRRIEAVEHRLDVAADHGQRGPQLVREVGEQLTTPVLIGFQTPGHAIERLRELSIVSPAPNLDLSGEIAVRDAAHGLHHVADRTGRPAHSPHHEDERDDQPPSTKSGKGKNAGGPSPCPRSHPRRRSIRAPSRRRPRAARALRHRSAPVARIADACRPTIPTLRVVGTAPLWPPGWPSAAPRRLACAAASPAVTLTHRRTGIRCRAR